MYVGVKSIFLYQSTGKGTQMEGQRDCGSYQIYLRPYLKPNQKSRRGFKLDNMENIQPFIFLRTVLCHVSSAAQRMLPGELLIVCETWPCYSDIHINRLYQIPLTTLRPVEWSETWVCDNERGNALHRSQSWLSVVLFKVNVIHL